MKLLGRKDVEDALRRLDKLTQEEARMATAESLTVTRGIDDKVKDIDERLEGVDERVQGVDVKVAGIDDKVLSVESQVQGIDDKVLSVDSRVRGVDYKVGSVIQGESCFHSLAPESVLSPARLGVKKTGVAIQQVINQFSDLKGS
jgi:archaellum component FlaC